MVKYMLLWALILFQSWVVSMCNLVLVHWMVVANSISSIIPGSIYGTDFRGWWSKLEQFLEAEGTQDDAKIRMVMLYLERRALD